MSLFNEPTGAENSLPSKTPRPKKALGMSDFLSLKFSEYEFTGHWLAMFGNPEKNFRMLIYGPEKNGKTDFTIKFCRYLAQFGKLYYNSHEEGKSKTLQACFRRNNMLEVSGKVLLLHKEPVEDLILRLKRPGSPRFVVFDSVDYIKMTEAQYQLLIDTFPKKAFILISWCDAKEEPLTKAARRIAKRVDIKVKVRNFTAYSTSRFAESGNGNQSWKFRDATTPANPITTPPQLF